MDYRDVIKEALGKMPKEDSSQEKLAKVMGCKQATVSYAFNKKQHLRIDQVIDAANYLGLAPEDVFDFNEWKSTQSETLSDFFKMLYRIDARQEIIINDDLSISFSNEHTKNMLKEWKELRNCSLDEQLKTKMLDMWKKETLDKARNIKASWGYISREQHREDVAALAMRHYITITEWLLSDIPDELKNEESINLINEKIEILCTEALNSDNDLETYELNLHINELQNIVYCLTSEKSLGENMTKKQEKDYIPFELLPAEFQ